MGDKGPGAGSNEATRLPERVVTAIMPRLRGEVWRHRAITAMGAAGSRAHRAAWTRDYGVGPMGVPGAGPWTSATRTRLPFILKR